jgi:hypothetical protein
MTGVGSSTSASLPIPPPSRPSNNSSPSSPGTARRAIFYAIATHFRGEFSPQVQDLTIQEGLSAPRAPWQPAYVERVIGTIRRECLDHVLVFKSPERRRIAVQHARDKGLSERRACRLVNQPRGTHRYQLTRRTDEDRLTQAIVALASQYGRYGYRRITALLQLAGWCVGKNRVLRIWRKEGLKVPSKQKPRGRLWLNAGSCTRLRPERCSHVWSYDFVEALTHDGRSLRLLT